MRIARLLDRLRTRTAAFAHDLVMIPLAWVGAFWLRFNLDDIPAPYLDQALGTLPVMVLVQGAVFWYFGLYRGVWRFASLPDLVRIVRAVVVGAALGAVLVFFQTRMLWIPRSVFPLFGVLLVLLLGGPRLVYRWSKDNQFYRHLAKQALIVGAGSAGEALVRDLMRDRSYGYYPVGFVDDDPEKKGREIHGVRVLGYCKRIPEYVRATGAKLVIIAVPSATSAEMRRIVGFCEKAGVPMRTLPKMQDLVSGRAAASELRAISIEDLLGREPVTLDWRSIERELRDRVVLVTGGGGSIGSELCRQIARLRPRELVVLDNGEFNLYTVERELRAAFPGVALSVVLADVCDAGAVERACARWEPEVVFHAAAYKHVPMLEHQAREAVRVNVFGTERIARAAARHGARCFVLISTDKAVNPANAMGASKRAAELVCQLVARASPATRFITVRFGNVLDSAGSVVPLFRRQIAAGGPITVTHPEVKRYFMTIPESCQLILEAAAIGAGGEVFVLDMGEPVRIAYLAEQMILLAGKRPGDDVHIEYVGLRPGEKLFEELFNAGESLAQTDHPKLLLARSRELDAAGFSQRLDALRAACDVVDDPRVREVLGEIVPELPATGDPVAANVIPIEQRKR